MKYYGYCRVSTLHQNEQNQHWVIEQFAKKENIVIHDWVEEKISSSKKLKDRKLNQLLNNLQEGDVLLCSELSRLSRSLIELMNILQACLEKKCQVWTLKENYRLGDNIQSQVLAFAFGLTAELSKKLLQERIKESLDRLKANGKKLGRPVGARSRELKLSKNKNKIIKLLEQDIPKAQIARLMNVSKGTLYRFLNTNQLR